MAELSTLGSVIKTAYEGEADTNAFDDAAVAALASALQPGANISTLTNDAGYEANVALASQAEAEAGTENTKTMTALRVAQAIAALAGGGGISEVSEDTSPTLGGDLSLGGFKLLSGADDNAVIKLGDNAGTRKLSITDSGDVEVAYINSDGAFRTLANDGFAIAVSGQPAVGIRRNSSVGGLDIHGNTTSRINVGDTRMLLDSAMPISWSPSSVNQNPDVGVIRSAAGVVKITNGSTGGGALELLEQTAPSAPSTNAVRFYAEDNGSGKTRLMAIFPSGAAQQVAIEP